ncbi:hypothetical protein PVAP13_7KG023303 [Panicum virgatum]|uniref:Uncharacterized protein n=1 Tax=Panicum virgatum TaxID=38727 RepID=A0A8T0QCA0_PANVG|nr:hypothetical protein PVAP13_7KG023303 [Panicum virgatum]
MPSTTPALSAAYRRTAATPSLAWPQIDTNRRRPPPPVPTPAPHRRSAANWRRIPIRNSLRSVSFYSCVLPRSIINPLISTPAPPYFIWILRRPPVAAQIQWTATRHCPTLGLTLHSEPRRLHSAVSVSVTSGLPTAANPQPGPGNHPPGADSVPRWLLPAAIPHPVPMNHPPTTTMSSWHRCDLGRGPLLRQPIHLHD